MHMLDVMPPVDFLHLDKGYDSDALRRRIKATGTAPNIPPKRNRRWKPGFSLTSVCSGGSRDF